MLSIAIIGASGVVGSRVLHHLLARDDVGRVVALGRRALPLAHDKLVSRIVDLQSTPAMSAEIPADVAAAICCLGTTMKQAGSREAFAAVDRDAVLAFARAALERGAKRFVLVSATGASPRSRNFYLRTKGEAEEGLRQLGFAQLTIVRPSFIDDQGARADHRAGERIGLAIARPLFAVIGKSSRYAPVTAETIGKAAVQLAFDDTSERVRVVESDRLHLIGA